MSEVNANGSSEAEGALLIGDGNPVWLHNIFTYLAGSTDAKEKGLIAALYIIMYESGFYFCGGPYNETDTYDIRVMRLLNDPRILLKHIKKENSKYCTAFSHELIDPKVCKIVSYAMSSNKVWKDPMLVVNFLLPDNYEVKTFLFPFKKYITIDSNNNGKLILRRNTELSLTLKNLLYHVKCSVNEVGCHPLHIFSLPTHILQHVCYYLDRRSFVKLFLTSKFLYETLSDDESLWKHYSLIDFRGLNKVAHDSWKVHYKYQVLSGNTVFRQSYFNTPLYSMWC